MLNLSSLKFFEELLRTSGPSGYEIPCAQVFRKRLEKYADEIKVDVTGNSIAVLNPKSPFKVMLAGHYDEIGFQVVYITDNGLITFRQVGGIGGRSCGRQCRGRRRNRGPFSRGAGLYRKIQPAGSVHSYCGTQFFAMDRYFSGAWDAGRAAAAGQDRGKIVSGSGGSVFAVKERGCEEAVWV